MERHKRRLDKPLKPRPLIHTDKASGLGGLCFQAHQKASDRLGVYGIGRRLGFAPSQTGSSGEHERGSPASKSESLLPSSPYKDPKARKRTKPCVVLLLHHIISYNIILYCILLPIYTYIETLILKPQSHLVKPGAECPRAASSCTSTAYYQQQQ